MIKSIVNRFSASSSRVVIVGANFGGLAASSALTKLEKVTVIDPSPHFEFLPNIHELVSGQKRPADLRLSRAPILARNGHRFVTDVVTGIDLHRRKATTRRGDTFSYDYLIIACGGVNQTGGVPGADVHALPFKTVDDCEAIGNRLRDLARRDEPASVVIVGGGIEGIEALGEVLRRYRKTPLIKVHLVTSSPRLMADSPEVIDREVRRICSSYQVTFHMGTQVTRVGPGEVQLGEDTTLPSDLTIWTGGAGPPPLLAEAGLVPGGRGWAQIRSTLQCIDFENVFVVGDAGGLQPGLPKQAYHALDMGSVAGGNVLRLIRGQSPTRFNPSPRPTIISFGDLDTFLVVGRTVFAGARLAAMKEAVYQLVMAQVGLTVRPGPIAHMLDRLGRGVTGVIVPSMVSVAETDQRQGVRVLR